jgi:SAM-dependent methyltransferase
MQGDGLALKFILRMRELVMINPSRVRLEQFVSRAAAATAPGSSVLDAGAGDCRYRRFFADRNYESADFCQVEKQYAPVTYVCDLAQIPVSDANYDLVLCTQVLEHVSEPRGVLREFARVLKPGGQLWLTAPLFYEEHEVPFDFYRYTRYGLNHLVSSAGLSIDSLDWLEGYYGTLSYQMQLAARSLSVREARDAKVSRLEATGVAASRLTFRALARFFAGLELKHKYTGSGLCKNYAIVATKPRAESLDAVA